MTVINVPLQAPYAVHRGDAQSFAMVKPQLAHRFTARVSSVISRGLDLTRAAGLTSEGDRWTARLLLNGRPVAIEAPLDEMVSGPVTFSVWVDASACAQNGESPATVALRAVEVLGLDDFPSA